MKICVHSFRLSDVEDPELYAAEPIWDWQQTEKGQWVMENCTDKPVFYTNLNPKFMGYEVKIVADFTEKNLTYFKLRWG
jgi:hypothetical protein